MSGEPLPAAFSCQPGKKKKRETLQNKLSACLSTLKASEWISLWGHKGFFLELGPRWPLQSPSGHKENPAFKTSGCSLSHWLLYYVLSICVFCVMLLSYHSFRGHQPFIHFPALSLKLPGENPDTVITCKLNLNIYYFQYSIISNIQFIMLVNVWKAKTNHAVVCLFMFIYRQVNCMRCGRFSSAWKSKLVPLSSSSIGLNMSTKMQTTP